MHPEDIEKNRLYYNITEVADFVAVNLSTIRYWESEFKQLKPRKNGKGDRLYTKENIKTLRYIIYLLKEKGYTIEGARCVLNNQNNQEKKRYQNIKRLEGLRFFLTELKKNI